MSDLTHMKAERARKALQLRDGTVDFGEFVEEWLNIGRDVHGLPTPPGRLEILV